MDKFHHVTLVYLYGPPASGKLTVAGRLAEQSGYRLFHNHLTVNAIRPVLDFGTEPLREVLHRLRLDVLRAAARAGIDVIFTNNSAWAGTDGRARFAEFADTAKRVTEEGGERSALWITAPLGVLIERVGAESRRAHGKLLDPARLREMMASLDETSLHPDDLVIDTSAASPDEAVQVILQALRLPAGI
jgi:shikimate kinase